MLQNLLNCFIAQFHNVNQRKYFAALKINVNDYKILVQFISIPMLMLKKVDNMQVVLEILLISLQISKKKE